MKTALCSVYEARQTRISSLSTELNQQRRRRRRKLHKFALLQTLSRLFRLVQFVKCWQIFLELNSKQLYRSSGKEKESRSPQNVKLGIFHAVVVQ